MAAEWVDSFEVFGACVRYNLADRPEKFTLDRIDNDGDYAPGNVRWADRRQQARNRTDTIYFTLGGRTRPIVQWVEKYSANGGVVRRRMREGWDLLEALQAPTYNPHAEHPPEVMDKIREILKRGNE